MGRKLFEVILTNGTIKTTYRKYAFCLEQARILAQADAIRQGSGYDLVDIKVIKEKI